MLFKGVCSIRIFAKNIGNPYYEATIVYKFKNEVETRNDGITAYSSSLRKSLHRHVILLHSKEEIFSLSYAVIPSFLVSVLFIEAYFIFKF